TTSTHTVPLLDALPLLRHPVARQHRAVGVAQELRVSQLHRVAKVTRQLLQDAVELLLPPSRFGLVLSPHRLELEYERAGVIAERDRKSTRLNSSHVAIS